MTKKERKVIDNFWTQIEGKRGRELKKEGKTVMNACFRVNDNDGLCSGTYLEKSWEEKKKLQYIEMLFQSGVDSLLIDMFGKHAPFRSSVRIEKNEKFNT